MTAPVLVILINMAALVMVCTGGSTRDPQALIAALILVQLASSIAYAMELNRHQKLLEWFQNHIRLETSRLPEDAPDDLVGKDDNDDDEMK